MLAVLLPLREQASALYQADSDVQSDEYLEAARAAQDVVGAIAVENEAIYSRPILDSATACCAVDHELMFTRVDVNYTITQPQVVGEMIRLEIQATMDGVPVATDNEYFWYGLTEICADWTLDWQQALREAVAAVVLR